VVAISLVQIPVTPAFLVSLARSVPPSVKSDTVTASIRPLMAAPPPDRPVAFHATWFDERELDAVRAALSGQVSGDGPIGRRVEARLAARLGAPRVLLTTSGTHAIELALLALGIGPARR